MIFIKEREIQLLFREVILKVMKIFKGDFTSRLKALSSKVKGFLKKREYL